MLAKTEQIWMDGKLIPWGDANVHILTHTLHYGVGVFEGIRYYDCGIQGSAVFRLKEHMRRFSDGCKVLSLKQPYSSQELIEACLTLIRANKLKEGYIRPLAFISEGPNAGLWAYENPVRVAILTWGWETYLGKEGVNHGIRAKISSLTRHHRNIAMTNSKVCGQYFNSVLAKQESKVSGFDEAIMLDPEGFVAEGTGENIFLVRDGVVKTPPLGSIIPGITRDTVITLLSEQGISVKEEQIARHQLYIADEVFLTGTAAEITPVREVDMRTIGNGTPGPITKRIQQKYSDLVRGKIEERKDWLTFTDK